MWSDLQASHAIDIMPFDTPLNFRLRTKAWQWRDVLGTEIHGYTEKKEWKGDARVQTVKILNIFIDFWHSTTEDYRKIYSKTITTSAC